MSPLALLVTVWLSLAAALNISHPHTVVERQMKQFIFVDYNEAFPNMKIDVSCDDTKKKILKTAWKESKLLAKAQTKHVKGYDYDLVHRTWLGEDWNRTLDFGLPNAIDINNRTRSISKAFKRIKLLYAGVMKSNTEILWWCQYPHDRCERDSRGLATIAETWLDKKKGSTDSKHHTVWCEEFFKRETLGEQVARYDQNKPEQHVIDNFEENTAVTMFHETFHFPYLISWPRVKDYTDDSDSAYQMAEVLGTQKAYRNAHSYAMDGLAIYIQQRFQLDSPPAPRWVIEGTQPPAWKLIDQRVP